ncbi:hypothetical protein CWI37_1439p0010 [Hamiltosporidium tvaerminnensis]|uniref:Uncharacterized protein n=1 Tax=Hamiltosporidium tvaerminnensis TaxID=1176355 RepID=A0A4Q9KXN6_9MICR|nr:hypothetical protein CWI37_1439p0010 [Hamiltosporidium tvaerminnensis]
MYCTENKLGVSHSDGNFSIQDAKNSTQISNYENPPSSYYFTPLDYLKPPIVFIGVGRLFFECLRKEEYLKMNHIKKQDQMMVA